MLAALKQLLTTWWTVDRIRISPQVGRMLSLTPGQRVLILGAYYVINERHVSRSGDRIRYLLTGACTAELLVQRGDRRSRGILRTPQNETDVFDSDFQCCPEG